MKKILKYVFLAVWFFWAFSGISKNFTHYSFLDWIIVLIVVFFPVAIIIKKSGNNTNGINNIQNISSDTLDCNKSQNNQFMHKTQQIDIESEDILNYLEDGVEKYEILATLDSKTCDRCGKMDGKIYYVKNAKSGINFPPFHENCRCTTVPHYDDTDMTDMTRAARDADGNPIEVPADMTWKEWKKSISIHKK